MRAIPEGRGFERRMRCSVWTIPEQRVADGVGFEPLARHARDLLKDVGSNVECVARSGTYAGWRMVDFQPLARDAARSETWVRTSNALLGRNPSSGVADGWDSNPRDPCEPAGFQDRCLQPLGHPSGKRASLNGKSRKGKAKKGGGDLFLASLLKIIDSASDAHKFSPVRTGFAFGCRRPHRGGLRDFAQGGRPARPALQDWLALRDQWPPVCAARGRVLQRRGHRLLVWRRLPRQGDGQRRSLRQAAPLRRAHHLALALAGRSRKSPERAQGDPSRERSRSVCRRPHHRSVSRLGHCARVRERGPCPSARSVCRPRRPLRTGALARRERRVAGHRFKFSNRDGAHRGCGAGRACRLADPCRRIDIAAGSSRAEAGCRGRSNSDGAREERALDCARRVRRSSGRGGRALDRQ